MLCISREPAGSNVRSQLRNVIAARDYGAYSSDVARADVGEHK